MPERLSEIRNKEVVNTQDGSRLGYCSDFILDLHSCCLTALIVPGPCRFCGLIGCEGDYVIPWQCVKKIGNDIILVDICRERALQPRNRKKLL